VPHWWGSNAPQCTFVSSRPVCPSCLHRYVRIHARTRLLQGARTGATSGQDQHHRSSDRREGAAIQDHPWNESITSTEGVRYGRQELHRHHLRPPLRRSPVLSAERRTPNPDDIWTLCRPTLIPLPVSEQDGRHDSFFGQPRIPVDRPPFA